MTPLNSLRSRTGLVLVAGMLLFTLGTTYMNWVKYISLRSGRAYDLGYYHNTTFNAAQGRQVTYLLVSAWFDESDHNGPSVFRSSHFSPVQSFLIPQLYRLYPSILMLMLVQSFVLAIGALPLYWLAIDRTSRPALALLLGLSYLFHPAILHLAFNDYRPIALGIGPALFALWCHATRRLLGMIVAALLMLSSRSEYVLVLALFGLINWRIGGAQARGTLSIAAPLSIAVLWAGLTEIYYLLAYGRHWPLTEHAVASRTVAERVATLWARMPVFFRIVLLPAAIGLLFPEAFITALPFVASALRLFLPSFPHRDLQHLSPALVVVFWAFAGGVLWLWHGPLKREDRRTWLLGLLAAAALASFGEFAWSAARTYLIGGFSRYEEISRINDSLPRDATVVVPTALAARFSNHTRVLTHQRMPVGSRSELSRELRLAVTEQVISVADLVATEGGEEWMDEMVARSGRYEPGLSVDGFQLFLAREDAIRPENADVRLQSILRWDQMSETKLRWSR
jgi:hypothetical protein